MKSLQKFFAAACLLATYGSFAAEAVLSGAEKAVQPDNAWKFPGKIVRFNNVPDWGKEGFTLEVWAQPTAPMGGYIVLMRGCFGYPKLYGDKNFDCYFVPAGKKPTGGRIYTNWELNKYQYYTLALGKNGGAAYYNGKAMRKYEGNCVPVYLANVPLHFGNSIGWDNNFKGKIGMVRIHNRCLTAQEIQNNYTLLQNNRALPQSNSVIFEQDRRVLGNFYKFNGGKAVNAELITIPGMISMRVMPEKLSNAVLLKYGNVTVKTTADGALTVVCSQNTSTTANVFKAGTPVDIAFAWNSKYNYAGCFVNGKFTGRLFRKTAVPTSKTIEIGENFTGTIGQIETAENTLLPDRIGETVTVVLDNRNIDKTCYPLSRHLVGKKESITPVIDFEDLTGWTMSYPIGAVKPVLSRSKEEPLWGKWVLRTEFGMGDFPQNNTKVVLKPPKPIKITEDFDTIAIWRFATHFSKPYPKLGYSIEYRDSTGKRHTTGYMGGMLETGWGIHMKPLQKTVKAPAEIVSITFTGFNEARRVTYFDSLHVYKRPSGPLPEAKVPTWQELGLPLTEDTIMPTALEKGKVTLQKSGSRWIFTSVAPSGKKLLFTVDPATGTLGDITATYKNKTFKIADGGGFYWALNNIYPVRPDALLAPNSPRVSGKLLSASPQSNKLLLSWQYTIDKSKVYQASWLLEVKDNTLIADLKADPMVGEFKFGAVTGISGKVVEVPYLTWGRWIHPSNPPGIFAADGFYVSAFIDWYNSDASGLFGESSSTPGGYWKLNATTADHRWYPDDSTRDKSNDIRDVSIINGGSYYWPKTDGKRNPARERLMFTVNETLDSVLLNIPNPPRKYLAETVNDVWCTRQWYIRQLPMMNYFDIELDLWKEFKAYGVDEVNMRLHGNVNRMYTPRHDGSPTTFINSFTEPQIGGDEKLAWLFSEMKKMGFRVGIYTDHMLLSCMSDGWDIDKLNLDSNGKWLYSSGNDKQTKISRMVALQKEYNAIYRKLFAPTCAYLDQITCPPCWRYTDYDARAPEAAKFSAAYRVFVESLRAEEADFGPVLSEGKTQIFFAGLCDSYAQPQRLNMNLLPNFNLRKMHMLSNDCGYHLSEVGIFGDRKTSENQAYRLLSYEHAYGNTGHLSGIYVTPHMPIPAPVLRSYFLIQPAQKYYALVPIKDILYNINGKFGTVDDAIKAGTLAANQIKLVYENGYEVAVNMNEKANFAVTLNGKKYLLPPCGFAGYLPGKVEFYSALNSAGTRSSMMREGNLLYVVNPQDIAEIKGKYDYALRSKGNTLELTPTPFIKAETVSVKVPAGKSVEVTAVDRSGKAISKKTAAVEKSYVNIAVDGKAFRYIIRFYK